MHIYIIQLLEQLLLSLHFVKDIFELIFGAVFYFFEAFVRLFVQHPRKDVEGEIALVTGAANGIGKLIAKELGRVGVTLVLWDVKWEALDQTAKELRRSLDVRVYAYACDCSRRSEIYRVAEMVKKEVGDVTILVNNAGVVTGKYSFIDTPDSLVDRTLRVNVAGHFWTYKAFLPAMLQRNHGHLVCVACLGGLFAMNGLADYCASKFAAIAFAESIALELLVLKKEGIKTTIVCPYLTNTTMFRGCRTKWPSFLPVMDKKEVAKMIVDAILREKMYLMQPGILYFLFALKRFFKATFRFDDSFELELFTWNGFLTVLKEFTEVLGSYWLHCLLRSKSSQTISSRVMVEARSSNTALHYSPSWSDSPYIAWSLMPTKLGIIFVNFFGLLDLMDHYRGVPVPVVPYKKPPRQRNESISEPQDIIYYN